MREFVDGKYYGEVVFTDTGGKEQTKNDWIDFTNGEFLGLGSSQMIERVLPQYYGIPQEQQVSKAVGEEVLLIPITQTMAIVKLKDGRVIDTYVRNIRFQKPRNNNNNNNNYQNSNNNRQYNNQYRQN